jgi:hypothetical protein
MCPSQRFDIEYKIAKAALDNCKVLPYVGM